jgi:hypothetical protein
MTRDQWGLVVWGGLLLLFLGLELPAVWHLVPWPTASTEVTDGEQAWHPFAACVLAILFVLALHWCFHMSPLPLIVVSAGTAAGLALHFVR